MSTNPPAVNSSMSPIKDSQPSSKDGPPVPSESEAMRRMQDLLNANKVSISDTVVFEYNRRSFVAHIMPDGSLKSNPQTQLSEYPDTSLPFKLYSSPSEFASDMAARALLLDEKVSRPRGKISINGWSNCTVNGRALATIRNEMLHERKNETAHGAKEKAKDSFYVSVGVTPVGADESSRPAGVTAEQATASRNLSLRDSQKLSQLDPKIFKDPCNPTLETKKHDVTSRPEEKAKRPTQSDVVRIHDVGRMLQPERAVDIDPAPAPHQDSDREQRPISSHVRPHELKAETGKAEAGGALNEGLFADKAPPLDEGFDKNLSSRNSREPTGSVLTRNSGGDPHEVSRPSTSISDARNDLDSGRQSDMNMVEPTKREVEAPASLSFPKNPENEVKSSKGEDMSEESKERMDIEVTTIPSPDRPSQNEPQKAGELVINDVQTAEVRNEREENVYDNISLPKDQKVPTDGVNDKSQNSDDDDKMDQEMIVSAEPIESRGSDPRDSVSPQPVPSQFRSLKEVSDLQQEILGDSDSDEESFTEDEQKPISVLKKRSRSPTINANKKRKRTGGYGSLETDGGTGTERFYQKGSRDGSDQEPGMGATVGTEIEATQLDPETMEAAAIAARIEKEEASNRARRTTRLAAGKIKQVDYKASTVTQAPQSVSPGHGSEENDRNSNDNDFPTETTRATRRRSTLNQLYPPQRSSRRVAKLRSSQEKDPSSNDEIDNPAASFSSRGNGNEYRSDKEAVDTDDLEVSKDQGCRGNGTRTDGNDRRRGRIDASVKRARHVYHDEGDHDSQGRAYSTRASTQENSVVDAAEITDLGDPNDFLSESEEVAEEEDIAERSNGYGFTSADLKCIAEAVRACDSVDPSSVIEALGKQDVWKVDNMKNEKVETLLQEVTDRVQNLSKSLSLTPEDVNTAQVLSFLSAEVWRLSTGGLLTGVPRKPTAVLRKATREDQMRSTLERSRRKEHRDVEEMRGTLEKEMESRRRAELDSLYVEIQVSEAERALSREKARCDRVKQETEKYRDMESDIRGRLEKAKILVGQLRGEKDASDGANGNMKKEVHRDETLRVESRPNGSFATSPVLATRKTTRSDDDVEMTDKNITTTSQRLLEMDRLRVLIAAREAEAEEFQRICGKERMRFVSTLELKNRLETEIYLYRSHGAVTLGSGNASVLPPSSRIAKENVKKVEHRGPSAYGNRGGGNVRQKAGVAKNVSSVASVTNLKNNSSVSKPKPGPGKAGETPKPIKRKPIVKNDGNGSDKM